MLEQLFPRDTRRLVGLLIARGDSSYLSYEYRRLRTPVSQFIPIFPGINVLYGRNGSGKTQLLQALSDAAQLRHSALEGYVYEYAKTPNDPFRWPSVDELLQNWENNSEYISDFCGWKGYVANSGTIQQQTKAQEIIESFRQSGNVLLTRPVPTHFEFPPGGPHGSLKTMSPPRSREWIPVILPEETSPLIRVEMQKLWESVRRLREALTIIYESEEYEDDSAWDICSVKICEWLSENSWNPLVNVRNLGFWSDRPYGVDGNFAFSTMTGSIYLPPIEILDEFHEEWTEDAKTFSVSVEHEANEEFGYINVNDLPHWLGLIENNALKMLAQSSKAHGEKLASYAAELQSKLRRLLQFLPNLKFLLVETKSWRAAQVETPGIWVNIGKGDWDTPYVPAFMGSFAEQRWLSFALNQLIYGNEVFIVDEPERGLHRNAERHLLESLKLQEWSRSKTVVVATHSPVFLNSNSNLLHIENGKVKSLTPETMKNLEEMGIKSGDLITNIQSFLLVEGEHELSIFENTIGKQLEYLGCHLLAMRGAKNASNVFDAQLLFDFTDSSVFCLMDNLDSEKLQKIWIEAVDLTTKSVDAATHFIREALPRNASGENRFMGELLTKAFTTKRWNRINPCSLSKPDVLMYLDPKHLGMSVSWEVLLQQLPAGQNFKEFATRKYGANLSIESIRLAATQLQSLPEDFENLIQLIRNESLYRTSTID